MSHRIEYQWAAFHIPSAQFGLTADRYLIAIESGDSCTFSGPHRKRLRSWSTCMVGTCTQVLQQAVRFAAPCEGGGLQPRGHRCTPESYIRRIRILMYRAKNTPVPGSWHARLRTAPEHPAVEALCRLGIEPQLETFDGVAMATVEPPPEHLATYFGLIDRHIDDLPAWCWFEVKGLPAS